MLVWSSAQLRQNRSLVRESRGVLAGVGAAALVAATPSQISCGYSSGTVRVQRFDSLVASDEHGVRVESLP